MLPKEPAVPARSPLAVWVEKGHAWVLSRTIKRIGAVAVACGVIVAAGLAGLPFLHQGSIVPSFRETELLVDWEAAPGTSRPEMTRLVDRVRQEVPTVTGVRNFGAHVGRAVMGDEIVGINSAELWVGVDPEVEYDATVAQVTELIDGYPGLTYDVRTYLDEVSSQALTGSSYPIVVRVYGPDLDVLREKAEEVRAALAGIRGIEKLETDSGVEEPYVEIEVDLDRADDFGIKPGDVRRAAATIVSGIGVGSLFEDQKVFDVVVWGTPESRQSVSSIQDVLVDTPSGGYVRLGDVADVRLSSTLMAIDRDAVSRRIDVGIDVSGRDLGGVAGDVEEALALVDFPTEYHAELLGEYADRQAAQRRLLLVGAVALIGIFLLFQAAFDSWRRAALALVTLPLSVVGGIWFLVAFDGGELSLGAIAGFVVVLGLAARNSVSQMGRFSGLERAEEGLSGAELALRGSGDRSLPVLLTAVAVALAFAPFLVFAELPGHEILAPMALVVIGGLITSLAVQLFVVPAFYARLTPGAVEEA
jgi:Cu/Ag efflux pump CusA